MKKELEIKIGESIQSVLESMGLELLEIRFIPRRRRALLQITIDRMDANVSISDCERVSRAVSRFLDVEDPIAGSYSLEVSSPGFKRILRIPRDLPRFQDRRIRLSLKEPVNGKQVWIGILKSATEPLRLDQTDIGALEIPFSLIDKANLDE